MDMPATVLFVDDEADLQLMVATFFECNGYEVVGAANAAEARRLADGKLFQAIVLDATLASDDSGELMEFFKKAHPPAPIIIYTGREADDDLVQELMTRGARCHQLKDGSLEKLLDVVKAACA